MDGTSYISNSDGNRYVRYLYWNDDVWQSGYNWLDNQFDDQNPALLRANLFISPHVLISGHAEFCVLCEYHKNTMKEKFSLKDHLFNKEKVEYLATLYATADKKFNQRQFVIEVMERLLKLELKARIVWIAEVSKRHLPKNFTEASLIIRNALPEKLDETKTDDDYGDFIFAPLGEFIVRNGAKKEHLTEAFATLLGLTQRFSMEDAMRTFLNDFPKETLREYKKWAKHKNYHVRRLVSESMRPLLPWSKRLTVAYEDAVPFLEALYADKTRYVTRSVANHLNDIAKKDPQLVVNLLSSWKSKGKQDAQELAWMTKHALRTLVKQGNANALTLLGFKKSVQARVEQFSLTPKKIAPGSTVGFSFTLYGIENEDLLIDYVIDFVKAKGHTKPKVFKLKKVSIKKGEVLHITKKHRLLADATTFTLHKGTHTLRLQINGNTYNGASFIIH